MTPEEIEREGEFLYRGCRTCGRVTDAIYCSKECKPPCPHGKVIGDCAECDHDGDIAFDAARERG